MSLTTRSGTITTTSDASHFRSHIGQISRQSIVFFGGTMFTGLAAYLFKVYVARMIGAEALGIYALGMTIIGFVGVFSGLGLTQATVRFVPLYTATGKSDQLRGSVALSTLVVADLCAYSVWHYHATRLLLMMQPFVAILWGVLIVAWTRESRRLLRGPLLVAYILLGVGSAVYVLRSQSGVHERTQRNTAFLDSVVGNDHGLVVSPYWLSLDYVNEHYPQLWAFVPANCPTMQLLDIRYKIGTLILPAETQVPVRNLCGTHLHYEGERAWLGVRYWIYRSR